MSRDSERTNSAELFGRAQAVVCAKLPEAYPDEQLQASMRRYHDRLITELPLSYCPLFALVIAFASE